VADRPVILQVPLAYAPELGGVQTCARQLSEELTRSGLEVRVATVDPSHALARVETVNGVTVLRVPGWPRGSDVRAAPGLAALIRSVQPDIVHVQGYQTLVAPIAMATAAAARIPYLLTFHGGGHPQDWRNQFRGRQLKILRPLLARAQFLIATAEWEIEYYGKTLNLSTARFRLVPNGGDLPHVGEAKRQPGTTIVSLGRLERNKGHQRVVAAMPHVLREVPDARLWIAGDGPYRDDLLRLADESGVAERVEIRAYRDRTEYAQRLAGSAVAVLLSDYETHPMAALEAAHLKIPTLVADNSGMAELARKGFARAIPLTVDSETHADAIVRLIRDPSSGSGEVDLPSWSETARSFRELYDQILARQSR
jgi:glycosyltransferase involved in cell wall biosynthesis